MPRDTKKGVQDDRFRILFESATDAIMIIEFPDGVIESANRPVQEITGLPLEGILGKPITEFGIDQKIFNREGFHEGVHIRRADGTSRTASVGVRKIIHKEHRWGFLFIRDVTDKQLLERELITKHAALKNAYLELEQKTAELESMQQSLVQAGKLSALGRLAAGVAHELNQPLTAVKGFAQELVEMEKDPNENVESRLEFLEEIVKASDKMSRIIQQLRVFGRKSEEGFVFTEVSKVIEEVTQLLGAQFRSNGIQLSLDIEEGLPKIYCDPFQLEQVFINLVSNAKDAIKDAGERNGLIEVSARFDAETQNVLIEVSDNGTGIPESSAKNIFDPFFTTKEVGKGMGLGLSICYGILDKIQGSIVAISHAGQGAKFRVTIPVDFRKQNSSPSKNQGEAA